MNREHFEAWVMTEICISKSTLEGLRTEDGYRNSTLSGTNYNRMWNCWQAASKASEQQLAAVVAENAGLKNAVDIIETKYMNWEGLSDAFSDARGIKTPETDAYLAEVRASEAKHVYDSILDNPAVTDMGSLVDWLEQHAKDSASFAAQLRQGAAL